jgi:phage shock protein E
VPDAINIGHKEISSHLDELMLYQDKKIVVYCERGVRARMSQNALVEVGFNNVYHLIGDMLAWRQAGLSMDTPSK